MPQTLRVPYWEPVLRVNDSVSLSLARVIDYKNCSLEENHQEFAQRLALRLMNVSTPYGWLDQLLVPNAKIVLYCDTGGGPEIAFNGAIYQIPNYDPLASPMMDIVAFDPGFALMKSKDTFIVSGDTGGVGKDVIKAAVLNFGVTIGDIDGPNLPAPDMLNVYSVGQFITDILSDSAARGDTAYMARFNNDGIFEVVAPGKNTRSYVFDGTVCMSAQRGMDMTDMITQLRLYGQMANPDAAAGQQQTGADDPGFQSRFHQGDLQDSPIADPKLWGYWRDVLDTQNASGVLSIQQRIDTEFRLRGAPVTKGVVVTPFTIPTLRKGDIHFFDTNYAGRGSYYGWYVVLGVKKPFVGGMAMTLVIGATVDYQIQLMPNQQGTPGGINTGDTVTPSSDPNKVNDVLTYAFSRLGDPYVWGQKGRGKGAADDCSGYTHDVYLTTLGVDIGLSTSTQWNNPDMLTVTNPQPGDLVFFSNSPSSQDTSHVGIVTTNTSQMISDLWEPTGVVVSNIPQNKDEPKDTPVSSTHLHLLGYKRPQALNPGGTSSTTPSGTPIQASH